MSRPVILWLGVAAGAALGILVATISRIVSGRLKKAEFWTALPGLIQSLASGADHREFVLVYARLVKLLAWHLAVSVLQLAAAFAPVVAVVVVCGPGVVEGYNRRAVAIAIHPRQQAAIDAGGERFESGDAASLPGLIPGAIGLHGAGKLVTNTGELDFDSLERGNAWCTSEWGRLTMSLLGFDTHLSRSGEGFFILRPYCGDRNPVWPYLSDLEFLFYLAITLTSALTAFCLRKTAH